MEDICGSNIQRVKQKLCLIMKVQVIKEIPGSCSSTRRLMQPIDEMSCSSRHPDQSSRHPDKASRHPDEMSGPCSSLSQDAHPTMDTMHPTMDSTIGSTFDSSGNQFFTLPASSRFNTSVAL